MGIRAQPMIAVRDVHRSSVWYQRVCGLDSGHGGSEYEQLCADGEMVLQLHLLDCGHHHGTIGDPTQPIGNGFAVWFEIDDLDAANRRASDASARIVTALHWNPNANHRELWLRDPDDYLVVLADRPAAAEK